jgi:condensin-2 complex subunit D3
LQISEDSPPEWAEKLLKTCDDNLAAMYLDGTSQAAVSSEATLRYMVTIGELAQSCDEIPKRLVSSIQAIISQDFGKESSVKAVAFIVLGKLCLKDEVLAKKSIPTFARELETSDFPVVRNNIMVIMCDLCLK